MADEVLCHRLPAGHLPVRLVGMGVSGMDDTGLAQGMLFDQEDRQKQSRVDAVADEIKKRFATGLCGGVAACEAKAPGRGSVDSGGLRKSAAGKPSQG